MLRKSLIQLLATLLVALPLLGVFAKDTHAASSRIAVIKAMSGDVTVKKAGGSKAFRAFKKLSLNQGDQLMTGDDGAATLQFSNGTSSDDEMTVSANTTLTFSKLSSRKGSVTKVSMLKGTVWSDVKSIQNKDDEFQLETPTAIMGVRGTHFLSTVSPVSQSSQLVVLAGVVQVSATGGMQPPLAPALTGGSNGGAGGILAVNGGGSVIGGSSPSGAALSGSGGNAAIGGNGTGSALIGGSGSGGVVYVYPSQQIYLPGVTEPIPSLQQQISTVDIQQIVQQAGPEVLKAILQNVADIEKEQQEQKQKLPQSGSGDSLSQPLEQLTLDKLQANLNALLPAILNQAIKQNQVSQAAVEAALNQAVGQIDMTIQQLPVDNQQQKQIEKIQQQKEKLEALIKEQQKQQLEKAQQQLASVLAQIQQQMNQIAQANQQAQQQKQQQTENQYVSTLTEAQKAAYEAAKQQNQGKTTTTPTTPSTPAKSTNAQLGSLSVSGAQLSPAFQSSVTSYAASVGSDVSTATLAAAAADSKATVKVNGTALSGGSRTLTLAYGTNEAAIEVTAEDGTTKLTYTVQIVRQLINNVGLSFGDDSPVQIDFTSPNPSQEVSVPASSDTLELTVPSSGPALTVTVNGSTVTPEPVYTAALAAVPGPIAWKYKIPLSGGNNTIQLTAIVDGVSKTYTIVAVKPVVNVATLSGIRVDGSPLSGFASATFQYALDVPNGQTSLAIEATPSAEGAHAVVSGNANLAVGANTVTIVVTAKDGVTKRTYTITVTRAAAPLSTDATLSGLSLSSGVTLNETFSSAVTSYTANVANSVSSVTVTPTTTNANATVTVNGASATTPVTLAVGTTTITVVVTAQDGTKKTYTIAVTRATAPLSTDATLSGLSLSGGAALNETFSSSVTSYTANVANSVSSVTVTPTTTDANATVTVNGQSATTPVTLAVGSTTITVAVTAQNGTTTKTYKIVVTRAAAPLSTDATLSGLSLSGGAALNETFSSSVMSYTANVANSVSSVTVTPTTSDANATVTVNDASTSTPVTLAVGTTTITVVVTAQDGTTTKSYTLAVTRAEPTLSQDATLSGLSLSGGATLNETFSSSVMSYTANVANSVSSVTVTPTTSDANATVTVNDASATTPISLQEGTNSIEIVVSAESGLTMTYTITVTRAAAPLSSDATLSAIALDGFELSPAFDPTVTEYAGTAPAGQTMVRLQPDVADSSSSLQVAANMTALEPDEDGLYTVELSAEGTTILIVVTAEDGTENTYTISFEGQPEPTAGIPASLTGWSAVSSEEQPLTIEPLDEERYAVYLDEGSAGFDLTLNFNPAVITSVLLSYNGVSETYTADGDTRTIDLSNADAVTAVSLSFLQGTEEVGSAQITAIRGEIDAYTAIENVEFYRFADGDSYYDYYYTGMLSEDNEYFMQVDEAADEIGAELKVSGSLAINRTGLPPEDLEHIALDEGYNTFTVKITDETGLVTASYDLIVYRGDEKPAGLGVVSIESDEGDGTWNNWMKVYTLYVDHDSFVVEPHPAAGASVQMLGDSVTDNGDGTYTVDMTGTHAMVSLVTTNGSERWAEPLYMTRNALPSLVESWSVSEANDSSGTPIKTSMLGDYDGVKTYFASVAESTDSLAVRLYTEEGSTVYGYNENADESDGELEPMYDNDGSVVFTLDLDDGANSFTFELQGADGAYHSFYLNVARGAVSLRSINAYYGNYEPIAVTMTGPQTFFAATDADEITVYPDLDGDESTIYQLKLNGVRTTSQVDLSGVPDGLQDIEITGYLWNGQITSTNHLYVWKGAAGPDGIEVDAWNVKNGNEDVTNVTSIGVLTDRAVVPSGTEIVAVQPTSGQSIVALYKDEQELELANGAYSVILDGGRTYTSVRAVLEDESGNRYVQELRIVYQTDAELAYLYASDSEGDHELHPSSESADGTDYVYYVPANNAEIVLQALATSYSTVAVNGEAVDSYNGTITIPIAGTDPLSLPIVVTSVSGDTKTYTLTLVPPAADNEASLVKLIINDTDVYPDADGVLTWSFAADSPEAQISLKMLATNPSATATINGMTISRYVGTSLTLHNTLDIPFQVKAADGVTLSSDYTLRLVKETNSDAGIYNINVGANSGAYAVYYDDVEGLYKLYSPLDGSVGTVTLLVTTNRSDATLTVDGSVYPTTNGNPSSYGELEIGTGDNYFDLMVTASDGTTNAVQLKVVREPVFPELGINDGSAYYAEGELWYQPYEAAAASVGLFPIMDSGATLQLLASEYDSEGTPITADYSLPLSIGANVFYLLYTDAGGHSVKKKLNIYNRTSGEASLLSIGTNGFVENADKSWYALMPELGASLPATLPVTVALGDAVSISAYDEDGVFLDGVYTGSPDLELDLPVNDPYTNHYIFVAKKADNSRIAYRVTVLITTS